MTDPHEPKLAEFVRRWSRRKRDTADGETPLESAPSTAEPETPARPLAITSEAVEELDRLDALSDYTRFMASDTPDQLRTLALRKLWTSDPAISTPDDLDDYLEDFREAAKAIPAALLRSAYQAGRGFVVADDIAGSTERDIAPAENDSMTPHASDEAGADDEESPSEPPATSSS